VATNEEVVPISQLREAYSEIWELERALERKTMEIEILRTAQDIERKRRRCAASPGGDHTVGDRDLHVLGIARRTAYYLAGRAPPAAITWRTTGVSCSRSGR